MTKVLLRLKHFWNKCEKFEGVLNEKKNLNASFNFLSLFVAIVTQVCLKAWRFASQVKNMCKFENPRFNLILVYHKRT